MAKYTTSGSLLLELLISLSLGALVCALATPHYREWRTAIVWANTLREIRHTHAHLSYLSQSSNRDITLELWPDSYKAWWKDNSSVILVAKKLPPWTTLRAPKVPLPISYYRSGVVTPQGFELSKGQTICKFTISLRGRLKQSC